MKKTALITGGALRIGRSLVLELAASGYDIVLHYHSSQTDAEEVESLIKKQGKTCQLFKCDLSNEQETLDFIPMIHEKIPELNLIINNASIFSKATIIETEIEQLNLFFNINFKAPFIITRDFARLYKTGQIINITDTKTCFHDYQYAVYTLTKKCLTDFTLMAAKEFGPQIRINAIAPGLILPPKDKDDLYLEKMAQKIPLKTKGQMIDIIQAMHYLIENPYITGQVIYVDGGQHLI